MSRLAVYLLLILSRICMSTFAGKWSLLIVICSTQVNNSINIQEDYQLE